MCRLALHICIYAYMQVQDMGQAGELAHCSCCCTTQPLWLLLLLTQRYLVRCEQCSVRNDHAHHKHAGSYLGMRIRTGIPGVRCWRAWRWRWWWRWGCMGASSFRLLDQPEKRTSMGAVKCHSTNGDVRSRKRRRHSATFTVTKGA